MQSGAEQRAPRVFPTRCKMFDATRFHELAGFFEYDDGMTRFKAEERAASRLGIKRYEAINAISKRDSQSGGDIRQAPARKPADTLPGMQPASTKEVGPLPVCDVPAGRGSLALLALQPQRGRVL
jgi:hypothetical protein